MYILFYSQALSATFLKADVLSKEKAKKISNCLIRAACVSYSIKHGRVENIDHFANQFMKHKTKTLQKHYHVKHFSSAKTLRYSMNLSNIFGTATCFENMKTVAAATLNVKVDVNDMIKYVVEMLTNISNETGKVVKDEHLVQILRELVVAIEAGGTKQASVASRRVGYFFLYIALTEQQKLMLLTIFAHY